MQENQKTQFLVKSTFQAEYALFVPFQAVLKNLCLKNYNRLFKVLLFTISNSRSMKAHKIFAQFLINLYLLSKKGHNQSQKTTWQLL